MTAGLVRAVSVGWVLILGACGSTNGGPDGGEGACSPVECDRQCRSEGFVSGSCDSGSCRCADESDADADSDGPGPDARDAESEVGDLDHAAEDVLVDDGAGDDAERSDCPCNMCPEPGDPPLDPDHRIGGAPGVVCDRLQIGMDRSVEHYDAEPGVVVFTAMDAPPPRYETRKLFVFHVAGGSVELIDDLQDLIDTGIDRPSATNVALDGDWIAYAVGWTQPFGVSGTHHGQLRLANRAAGTISILRTYEPGLYGNTYVGPVAIEYPWIAWRETERRWCVHAANLETGVELDISCGAVDLALEGTTLVTETSRRILMIDLETGIQSFLGEGERCDRWEPDLAWPWVVWLDQRNGPGFEGDPYCNDYRSGCWDNDIYAYNRLTGTEVPLLVGHGMQGYTLSADGDWAAYEDNRDGFDEFCWERCQQVYAYHLPTGREIRITDWPAHHLEPIVYGGNRVLFSEQTAYMDNTYDLWDCSLPEVPPP